MKIFQSAQRRFAILGIGPNKPPWNGTTLLILFIFVILISFYAVFLVNMANTFKEYTENIYLTASMSTITFIFAVFVVKMKMMFELIDLLENCIEKSK